MRAAQSRFWVVGQFEKTFTQALEPALILRDLFTG
jgi:hypothetical protein